MALTRANTEAILIRRLGGIFEAVGLDGATADGSNEDLNDPIGWALRQLGKPPDPTAVSDADVAAVVRTTTTRFSTWPSGGRWRRPTGRPSTWWI